MALETTVFDPAEYLDDDEAIAGYLSDALETGEPAYIAHAIGVVARAKGMSAIAKETGLSRASLYRALDNGGNPSFATVVEVLSALGFQLHAGAKAAPKRKAVAGVARKAALKKATPKKTGPKKAVARKVVRRRIGNAAPQRTPSLRA